VKQKKIQFAIQEEARQQQTGVQRASMPVSLSPMLSLQSVGDLFLQRRA
jgi:hypothetical protein